jgi:hypothetical protein
LEVDVIASWEHIGSRMTVTLGKSLMEDAVKVVVLVMMAFLTEINVSY